MRHYLHASVTRITDLEQVPFDVHPLPRDRWLEAVGGSTSKAAKILGIGLRTLYRKLKEYGL